MYVLFPLSFRVETIKGQSGDDLNQTLPRSTRSIEMLAAEARSTAKAVGSLLKMECKQTLHYCVIRCSLSSRNLYLLDYFNISVSGIILVWSVSTLSMSFVGFTVI